MEDRGVSDVRPQAGPTSEKPAAGLTLSVGKLVAMNIVIFGVWQLVYHWIFMVAFPLQRMLAFHSVDWIAGSAGAALLTVFFVRILRRQNKHLRMLDRQKGLLVNAIVHDLSQPLSVMLTSMRSLRKEGGFSARAGELLTAAQSNASVLMEMVGDLLDAAHLEAGRPLVKLREIAPDEFITLGAEMLQPLAVMNERALRVSLPPGLPPVKGDRERLRRVVTNLVSNALKFTGERETITVTARQDDARAELLVSVAGMGHGVPPELRSRFSKKFPRFRPRRGGGLESGGIGLYFCELIVEAHGGKIWLESGEEQGTVFTFSIPTAPGRGGAS